MTKGEDIGATIDLKVVEESNAEGGPIEKAHSTKKAVRMLDVEIFGDVKIELAASLGRGAMTVSDLVNLTSGSVVPLDAPLNGLVDLTLKDRLVARGEIVSVGGHFGVRITEIVARN